MNYFTQNMIKCMPLVLFATTMFACSEVTTSQTNDTTQKVDDGLPANAPTYLVAVEASYPPYSFRDDKGYVIGYDADILKAVGKVQGFRVKILHQSWSGIFKSLDDGSRHILAAGANLTPERKLKYEFSVPVSGSQGQFFVKEDSDISNIEDLQGKTIATQSNASVFEDVTKLMQNRNANIAGYSTTYLAFKSLLEGKSDAVFANSNVLSYYINNIPKNMRKEAFKEVNSGLVSNKTVFYFKKGDTALMQKVNVGIEKIKANGTYTKINQKWFGKADTL